MRKVYVFFLVLVASGVTFGCAAPKKMYYWGEYSNSIYSCKKDATEENLLKHRQVLETIIKESHEKSLRVPPGVYAELGYICFRQNKNDDAVRYFDLESKTYPEAGILMQRLIQAAKAKDKEKDNWQ